MLEKVLLSDAEKIRNSLDEIDRDSFNAAIDKIVAAKNIYIRFKIIVILDYEERNEIVAPNIGEMWYRYNHDDESLIVNGVQFDDGYFYYKDVVRFQQRVELFSELEFVGDNIFCEDGGKFGQIQVIVESIEAVPENIINGSVWPTAPKHWVLDITN